MRLSQIACAAFLVIYLIGICGAVIAAAIEIETIVVTGPVFGLLGLAVALCGWLCRFRGMPLLGLSTSLLAISVFLLIFLLQWSPGDAQIPVTCILLAYEFAVVPFGLLAWRRMALDIASDSRSAWQFNLQSLLWLTGLSAVAMAGVRMAVSQGLPALPTVAVGFCTAAVFGVGLIGFQLLRHRIRAAHYLLPSPAERGLIEIEKRPRW